MARSGLQLRSERRLKGDTRNCFGEPHIRTPDRPSAVITIGQARGAPGLPLLFPHSHHRVAFGSSGETCEGL